MPIVLRELFREMGSRYGLELVGGLSGLDREVAWIHLCEEPENIAFLRGNDLVVTTGLRLDSEEWLLAFIQEILARDAAGLVLNTGKYIKPEHITPQILAFCEREAFALFTLPWHIRLSELMQDCCGRLLLAEQQETELAETVRLAVLRPEKAAQAEQELKMKGLSGTPYTFLSWRQEGAAPESEAGQALLNLLREKLERRRCPYAVFPHEDAILAVTFSPEEPFLRELLETAAGPGRRQGRTACGLSRFHCHAKEMHRAWGEACTAGAMAALQGRPYMGFREMGIYRLLFEVADREVLQGMLDERLSVLREHDAARGGQLQTTLRAYILSGGSLQGTADALFTHRNTVSYRLAKIRELLPCDLSSAEERFALLLAFYIEDYLSACAMREQRHVRGAQ